MKKHQPQKRLGRGLESLINGGLQKPAVPPVHIDKTRIERTDGATLQPKTPMPGSAAPQEAQEGQALGGAQGNESMKRDSVRDLNDLLKRTQEEARQDAAEDVFSNSAEDAAGETGIGKDMPMDDEQVAREAAGESPKQSPQPKPQPTVRKAEFPKLGMPKLDPNKLTAEEKAFFEEQRKEIAEGKAKNAQKNPVAGTSAPSSNAAAAKHEKAGASVGTSQGVFMLVPASAIRRSPFQRRKEFAAEAIRELAESIRSEGLMQPIVVRTIPEGGYELIAGERRMRACESIGMEVLPARVVTVADASAAVMGLIENLQRVDLNPVEEARGYGMLLTDFHMTQEQIAERVGKSRAVIANSLRLMLLEVEILGYLAKGQLTEGHAKMLLGLQEGPERVMLARQIVERGLSVREAEGLTRRAANVPAFGGSKVKTKRLASEEELAVVKELQERVVARLNAKVSVNHTSRGGRVVIYYKSNAELEGILKRMGV